MSISVLDRNTRITGLRTSFRKAVGGPECELVDWFLGQNPFPVPRGCRGTIFREPRLESGFPDLVAVIWHEKTVKEWSRERANLNASDIRVLHLLAQRGQCTKRELSVIFTDRLTIRLERLEAAGTVRKTKTHWRSRPLSQIFAVRRIIAFEAKLNQWGAVLNQANLNTWFASESYVLIPRLPRSQSFTDLAKSLGIGIWTRDVGQVHAADVDSETLPRSYASWLFNEWVWQASPQSA